MTSSLASKGGLEKSTLEFLKDLQKHNNRDWFQAHKDTYLRARENAEGFFDALIRRMNIHDDIETVSGSKALYRIYNDVRFSNDKTPYNPRFAGHLKRRKPYLRGGYYLWIKPGGSKLGCGFAYPNPADLKRVREDIGNNHEEWRRLLNGKTMRKYFGAMQGDQLKTAPQGFPKDHPAIDLLRYKQLWFEHAFTDKEVTDAKFLKQVDQIYQAIRPFFDYMSEVLTTDINGEPLRKL